MQDIAHPKGPELESWAGHPHTKKCQRFFSERAELAYKDMLAACRQTADANVRQKYQEWEDLARMARFFGAPKANGKDELEA